MAVSIRDVAKSAGVSVSTVSRALNGYTDVNEKTRKKIQETVQDLGYHPNQSAKNLSSKTQKNVALVISDFGGDDNLDEFTGTVLRGVYEYVNKRGETVAAYGINSKMQNEKSLEIMCDEYSLSGVILMGLKLQDTYLKEVSELDIPCVSIDTALQGEKNCTIRTDDAAAFEEITDYVLEQGHRNVVLVKGREEAEVTHTRYQGFRKSMEKHGLDVEQTEILQCRYLEEEAFRKTKRYIETYRKTKATAFVCMSDLMALGVSRAVKECGYSVPEDFSVTGFDGLYVLNYIKPGITTVDQNIKSKGYMGMKILNHLLEGKETSKNIFVPHKIIVRESVKKLDI